MFETEKMLPAKRFGVDRDIIQVRSPASHDGVTAALRRAFQQAAEEPSDRDFEALLRRLN